MTLSNDLWFAVFELAVLALIFPRWKFGLYAMICYIPISGAISLKLSPAIWPKEITDFLFIIPAYVAFCCHQKIWKNTSLRIPRLLLSSLGALLVLVVLEAFNPKVLSWQVAAIGIKVWLFYLPLLILGYFWLDTRSELLRVLRIFVISSWIPSTVGLIQFVGCHWLGYRPFMTFFYGSAAAWATQGFTYFTLGNGTLLRIPSTFAFSTQYMNYLVAMAILSYAFMQSEKSRYWLWLGHITFYWTLLATFLCGSRAAFVVTPMVVMALCLMDKKTFRTIFIILGTFLLMYISLKLPTIILSAKVFVQSRQSTHIQPTSPLLIISPQKSSCIPVMGRHSPPFPSMAKETADISFHVWGRMMQSLIIDHGYNVAYINILLAFRDGALGKGTGMNTGAARYAVKDPSKLSGYENYYAKTIVELGILGLLIVIMSFTSLLVSGFRIYRKLTESITRRVAAAIWVLLITFVFYNFKGVMIDLEPMNMYFWLLAGVLFKLPLIDKQPS